MNSRRGTPAAGWLVAEPKRCPRLEGADHWGFAKAQPQARTAIADLGERSRQTVGTYKKGLQRVALADLLVESTFRAAHVAVAIRLAIESRVFRELADVADHFSIATFSRRMARASAPS